MINYVESPPIITSIDENEAVMERLKNVQSWSILKDKRSDYIFATKKKLIHWSSLNELTSVSQMIRHIFCSKVHVYLDIYVTMYLPESYIKLGILRFIIENLFLVTLAHTSIYIFNF